MPVLSFPCAIHRPGNGSTPLRRRVWIKGHDFRTLAAAATVQLGAAEDQCRYGIVWPETGKDRLFLEISHPNGEALVGPMAGPLPPATMPLDEQFSLDTLIIQLGLDTPNGDVQRRDAVGSSRYAVMVTYSPIWQPRPFLPRQDARETDTERQDQFERARIERSSRQGFHVIAYDVPAQEWTAHDLEMLLVLAYRLLPTDEPRWRESGSIRPAKFVNPGEGRRVTIAPSLQVGRGDYVAHLRLPAFPAIALAEWLGSRHYDINLRHPVIKLEFVARGWRCVDHFRAQEAPAAMIDRKAVNNTEGGL
jgi:hypothetical protein